MYCDHLTSLFLVNHSLFPILYVFRSVYFFPPHLRMFVLIVFLPFFMSRCSLHCLDEAAWKGLKNLLAAA